FKYRQRHRNDCRVMTCTQRFNINHYVVHLFMLLNYSVRITGQTINSRVFAIKKRHAVAEK
ncbi:hypothetical protein N4Q55_26880, partial [Salmonella enterica subsp. enterica serovar Pomona]|uniref:hypothetical protein n=1 Tax=Salmonella enterica TaxID=28901 RepID=UPI00372E7B54